MLSSGNTTNTGGVKMQKLKSSEDIPANSLFVIKRGIGFFSKIFNKTFFYYKIDIIILRWSKRICNV